MASKVNQSAGQSTFAFQSLDAEIELTRRLKQHGALIFEGDTTPAARRERFRSAIVNHGLDMAIVGRGADGKCETYAAMFERIFHEPLLAKKGRRHGTT